MAKTIKIAPDLTEIRRDGNVLSCEFNNMAIRWCIAEDCNDLSEEEEYTLKQWLQTAIGMSSKMWQVPYLLNNNLSFPSKVYVNGKEVEFPKN